MRIYEILLIAISLSADAFAVSVTFGLSSGRMKPRTGLLPGVFFGVFQALMPLIGYAVATLFADKIKAYDHWLTLLLLTIIGGKMIIDGLKEKDKGSGAKRYGAAKLTALAFATSVDALAVGATFAFISVSLPLAVSIIGVMTFVISTCGVVIGAKLRKALKLNVEVIGGIVLILLGVKIFLEHTLFS